jgi:Zn-dependent protease with chaperone function
VAFAVLALVALVWRVGDPDMMLGVDRDTALLWVRACATGPGLVVLLLAVAAGRLIVSVRRQCRQTRIALRPLLALPAVSAPTDVAALLHALRLDERTRVIALDMPVALCYGLWRPRLLLSTGALCGLSAGEMEAVLRHEQVHLHQRDPLRLVVARALADAVPMLPALRQWAVTVPLTQELAADRAALAAVGAGALGGALLKVGSALGSVQDLPLNIVAFGLIDARIDQLLGGEQPCRRWPPLPGRCGPCLAG